MSDPSRRPGDSNDPERQVRETAPAAVAPYPRALPYRPAGETGSRKVVLVAIGALLLVAATAGATVFILNMTAPGAQVPAPAEKDDDPPPQADRGKKPPPKDKGLVAKGKKETPLPRTDQERFLKALGSMSAAHVYQTYLNLGLLADGMESSAWTKAEAEEMLTTVGYLIEVVDRELDKLADMNLSDDEKAGIKAMQNLTMLLRRQSNALRAYWTTGEQAQITRYQQAREAAWTELSDLLNLE
jgi:hypothetical protein